MEMHVSVGSRLMTGEARQGTKRYTLAFVATMCLFAVWGLAHRVSGIVSPQFVAYFSFTPFQSALTQTSFGISYFVFAIPAALFLRRFGYKLGLIFGLAGFSIGSFLLYPAISQHQPFFFLAAVIVSGVGWAFLETSANPLIVRMGPPETAVRRLNLAQSIYPVGLLIAAWLGRDIVLPTWHIIDAQFAATVVRPYVIVGLGILLLAFLIENIEYPAVAIERTGKTTRSRDEIHSLLAQPMVRFGLVAMAACMMALVSLWGVCGQYVQLAAVDNSVMTAAKLPMYMWLACGIGRFAGTGLMVRYDPGRLLVIFTGACLGCAVLAGAMVGVAGIFCLLGASFFISIMFPTIFAGTIQDLGETTKTASGMLVTAAGFGGILGTITMRLANAVSAVNFPLIVASLCLAVVLAYALAGRRAARTRMPAAGAISARA
jgi:MFS transporter, FHS family, L-fucose permease